MNKKLVLIIILVFGRFFLHAQNFGSSPEYIKALTHMWEGERFSDGRPKVSDQNLKRLEACTLEQIWGFLSEKGFRNQVASDWIILKPGQTMVGRAVTTQFMPSRPDLDSLVKRQGIAEGRSQSGRNNTWPIDVLTKGDIYVADGFGKVKDGTLLGSSLGNSITGKTGKGVIINGSIRDMQELKVTDNFNAWVKASDPSFIKDMTPISLNAPIRVDGVTVFPGDIVFANDYGIVFIPPFLVESLLTASDIVTLRDEFERIMSQTGKYLTGEVHGTWKDPMKKEFRSWFLSNPKKGLVTISQIDDYLAKLTK